jgi:hypothetical protein
MKIELLPYNLIENKTIEFAEILISPDLFEKVQFSEGKIVFGFTNCKFKKLKISNTSYIDFKEISILFSFCLIDEIEIGFIQSDKIGISFYSCVINGKINNKNIAYIDFNNCITRTLFLLHQKQINISYTEENIFIKKWVNLIQQIGINSIESLISLKQTIFIYHSKTILVKFNHNRREKKGVYRDRYNSNLDDRILYCLSEKQKEKLDINISIDFSNQEDKQLKIEDCILNSLELKGAANGKVSVENTVINNLFIRDFRSQSDALFYNIYPASTNSKLEVHKSNMDNSWFDNIDFNGYEILSFYRTRFAQASFTSCNFPNNNLSFDKFKTLENIHYPDKKPQNYYKDQYEIFLQLKKSLESTGNYYEAQKLGAISKESLRKITTLPIADKFILWLSAKSNNYGLSAAKPLLGLFSFSIIFYIGYLWSIDRIFNSCSLSNIDWTLFGHYFSFMDLTHRKDFLVSKEEYTFATLTLDFANKIIVGFFLFQFVTAFRKYRNK